MEEEEAHYFSLCFDSMHLPLYHSYIALLGHASCNMYDNSTEFDLDSINLVEKGVQSMLLLLAHKC